MTTFDDDSKVMDVSKPGRGKPIVTSRPIVAAVVSSPASDESISPTVPVVETSEPLQAPSSSHKTIEPISEDLSQEEPAESVEPKSEDSTETPVDASNDAAGVDALVSTAETKKDAVKKMEESAKKDAELQSLIDGKKYVVPIKTLASAGSKKGLIGIVIALVLIIAGYLAVDAGAFGSGVKLPFEVFKDSETADDARSGVNTDQISEAKTSEQKEPVEQETKPAETEDKGAQAGDATITPELKARDTDRKNEVKNLQMKLETYFNDNDSYPTTLGGLIPRPSAAETTDDKGVAYTYEGDGQTYTVSAVLEDKNDKDAVNGIYSLSSVNQ